MRAKCRRTCQLWAWRSGRRTPIAPPGTAGGAPGQAAQGHRNWDRRPPHWGTTGKPTPSAARGTGCQCHRDARATARHGQRHWPRAVGKHTHATITQQDRTLATTDRHGAGPAPTAPQVQGLPCPAPGGRACKRPGSSSTAPGWRRRGLESAASELNAAVACHSARCSSALRATT